MDTRQFEQKRRTMRSGVRRAQRLAGVVVVVLLAACGGGSGTTSTTTPVAPSTDKPTSTQDAARFMTQASFGARPGDTDRLMTLGLSAWIDEQIQQPQTQHRAYWDMADAEIKAADATRSAGSREVVDAFYIGAIGGSDQLRQRVAYAYSQIFVVSLLDSNVANYPRGVAGYLDLLAENAFGNYRTLLEAVSRHPMMGLYLSHLRNQKENPATGRVPDENFAREVMQLFSIGLQELNPDGSVKSGSSDTYTSDDIAGMARVFTGFSWYGTDKADGRFFGNSTPTPDPDRMWRPMQGYPKYHSTSEKRFLGKTIAAQGTADPEVSLQVALDALHNHPNVGPFIGKQLIQRLVTSNPSPQYVSRVATAFADNGAGVRGDMKAVIKAVLLDPEARDIAVNTSLSFGKVREPVLRLTAALRGFGATSDSQRFLIGTTDDPGTQLGQTPMRSPSVFNFYRPGFVAPNTQSGSQNLAAPELQITHETSVAGYANYMRDIVQNGSVGLRGPTGTATRRDVQLDLAAALAVADQPAALVDLTDRRLTQGLMSDALKTAITAAVNTVVIPASNPTSIDTAKRNRVNIAVYLTLVSPEFLVQK